MSDWLTRFDTALVTYPEVLALPHRVRVAWAKSQFTAVAAGFSPYLFDRYPAAVEAVKIADDFLTRGHFDLVRINALIRSSAIADTAEALQTEGYPLSIFQAVDGLLCCVASPFASECGQTMEEATALSMEGLVSSLGMTFATIQFWRQGVSPFGSDYNEDYHDALQLPFYEFSRAGYAIARKTSAADFLAVTFTGISLDWTIRIPIPAKVRDACPLKPPPKEWPQ